MPTEVTVTRRGSVKLSPRPEEVIATLRSCLQVFERWVEDDDLRRWTDVVDHLEHHPALDTDLGRRERLYYAMKLAREMHAVVRDRIGDPSH